MELETLACNGCGAPLTVPETANFVKCNYCFAQLAIHRTADASFTEQLDQLAGKTEELAERIAHLEWQNELAAADRDWQRERRVYVKPTGRTRFNVPDGTGVVVAGGLIVGFGFMWIAVAVMGGVQLKHSAIGLAIMGAGIVVCIGGFKQSEVYRTAYRRYMQRRAGITLESVYARRSGTPEAFLASLQNIPTPEEYLDQLEAADG